MRSTSTRRRYWSPTSDSRRPVVCGPQSWQGRLGQVSNQASPRDVSFTAVCADTEVFPITIHLGQKLAITSWLFRKPKYWVEEDTTRLTIEEIEQILAQRASSSDVLRAAVAELQQAVADLALALNTSADEAVATTAERLAQQNPLTAADLRALAQD